jgi:hypothetical protein
MQVVGEIIQPHFEFLPRREQLVLASGHGSDGGRDILAQGLSGLVGEVEEVYRRVHFTLVHSTASAEDIKNTGRMRERTSLRWLGPRRRRHLQSCPYCRNRGFR